MANDILTSGRISALAVELLYRSIVLPRTVSTVRPDEYNGPNGGTVTVRIRKTRTAQTQTTPGAALNVVDLDEDSVTVSLAHVYDALNLTDEELTYKLEDFASQVLEPQVGAVAIAAENALAGVINGLTAEQSFAATASADDTQDVLLSARAALTDASVPMSDRFLVVSSSIANRLYKVPDFVRADARGDGASSAIRDAIIGRVYGFTVVETPAIDQGEAAAYHRSALAFVNKVPPATPGQVNSAVATRDGIGVRTLRQYNPSNLSEQSVIHTYMGAGLVDGARVVKLGTAAAA